MKFHHRRAVPSRRILLSLAIAGVAVLAPPRDGSAQEGGSCQAPFVFREAVPGDRVCVAPGAHEQAQRDNAEAASRKGENVFGRAGCKDGFIVRGITTDDNVCVTPETREQVVADNALAETRRAAPGAAPAPIGPQGVLRMRTAFTSWAASANVNGTMYALNNRTGGPVINMSSRGNVLHDGMVLPVASLSKAITAVCVMELIQTRSGVIAPQSTIAQLMPAFADSLDAQFRWQAHNVRVEHLIRHTSGIGFDPTQQDAIFRAAAAQPRPDEVFARQAMNRALNALGGYFYNNVNYALLAMIIRTVTGEEYETYCKRTVLTPRGAPSARIGAGVRAMAAFGGWEIRASEYASFLHQSLSPEALARPERSQSQLFQFAQPVNNALLGSGCPGCNYGLGVAIRPIGGPLGSNARFDIWHHGNWPGSGGSGGTTPARFGAFAARWDNGYTVVVIIDSNLSDFQQNALRDNLKRAAEERDN